MRFLIPFLTVFLALPLVADEPKPSATADAPHNIPSMVEADGHLRLDFGDEHLVLPRGLQPSLLCTSAGTLILQAQLPDKPFPSIRMTYPYALSTVVSR